MAIYLILGIVGFKEKKMDHRRRKESDVTQFWSFLAIPDEPSDVSTESVLYPLSSISSEPYFIPLNPYQTMPAVTWWTLEYSVHRVDEKFCIGKRRADVLKARRLVTKRLTLIRYLACSEIRFTLFPKADFHPFNKF